MPFNPAKNWTGSDELSLWSSEAREKIIASKKQDVPPIWYESTLRQWYFPHDLIDLWAVIFTVKIHKGRIYISSISGAIAVLSESHEPGCAFDLEKLLPSQEDLGEIYSMDVDDNYILTGHTYASTSLQLWNLADVTPIKVIRENTSESIVWNLFLAFPLTLVCRDNEVNSSLLYLTIFPSFSWPNTIIHLNKTQLCWE